MVRLVIVYFVSLSCLSNLVLMRMCSCTLRSGFLFLLSTSEATREKDKHEKYLSDVCNITAEFIICSKTLLLPTLRRKIILKFSLTAEIMWVMNIPEVNKSIGNFYTQRPSIRNMLRVHKTFRDYHHMPNEVDV